MFEHLIMEYKYKNTLDNVLILADEEVMEILTKKSYFDACAPRAQETNFARENLCKLLPKRESFRHFGLNIKEKRIHKKIRHYTMKLVNFKLVLLRDIARHEQFIVLYRTGLSFNTNMANFYFSGVKTLMKRRRTNRKEVKRLKGVVRKFRNPSFKNYLRESIKNQFYKYLDGEYKAISVHAIFTVEKPTKSKVFITRDIARYSDINKFIKMIVDFDSSLNQNMIQKLEEHLGGWKIPINNVLAICQISPIQKNLFIQWNEALVKSLRGKSAKLPKKAHLIDTSVLKLRLERLSFNEAECTSVKSIVSKMEDLASKSSQGENIENKLEKQLNSCKTFMACLDAFEANHMSSDSTTLRLRSTRREMRPELKQVGDAAHQVHRSESISSDAKVQGILSKINMLQKRIRLIVKTSPSLHRDPDIRLYSMKNASETDSESFTLSTQTNSRTLSDELDTSSMLGDVVKRDSVYKSKFYKPDCGDVESNILRIKEFLKQDFKESRERIEGILRYEAPTPVVETPNEQVLPETTKASTVTEPPKEATLADNSAKKSGAVWGELLKVLKSSANSVDLVKIMSRLEEKYQKELCGNQKASKGERPSPEKPRSRESTASKTKYTSKKVRVRAKQKRTNRTVAPAPEAKAPPANNSKSSSSVVKLENFIEDILKITKNYFNKGSRIGIQNVLENVLAPKRSKTGDEKIITIKRYSQTMDTPSEMSTETVNSSVRRVKLCESAVQTDRCRRKKLCTKITQTDIEVVVKRKQVAIEAQTDISINKHAQIKFSGMNMQLSKNVTITNVRKNVINVRNICEETSEAVKRLLENEPALSQEDGPNLKEVVETISENLRKGNNKEEILGQIKNTLETVIDRFKKSTILISKTSNYSDVVRKKLPSVKKPSMMLPRPSEVSDNISRASTATTTTTFSSASRTKKDFGSNVKLSMKLLRNLSEVTKTIKRNPREAAKKLHGIRNELMHMRTGSMCRATSTAKGSARQFLPKTSSALTVGQGKGRARRLSPLYPRPLPLNMYGYPASNTDIKPDLNKLNRIFTPKTRSICNTELSIIKHRDRHADYIANHLNAHPKTNSKNCFNFKKYRSKSAQLKSRKCQMYIAKTYKKSYASTMSSTTCEPPSVPHIQTAIENPLVPKIVRPVRWKNPLPDSPQLSNLTLKDVKPFNSEYPRKDHVSSSTHSYLNRLLQSPEKHAPTIKCSDNDCTKCLAERSAPTFEDSECSKEAAHFKLEKSNKAPPQQVSAQATRNTPSVTFDFGKFMVDPDGNSISKVKMNFTVCPVNVLQHNKASESTSKASPASLNRKLCEVKDNQNKMQKSIQQAIIQNQEKFQVMQRILTLSKPQERKMVNQPPSSMSFNKPPSSPPKIKTTHTKKFCKGNDASTSKARNFPASPRAVNYPPQQTHSIQTAVATYKTVKQVQPHPKLKQLQQQQIPLKPKLAAPCSPCTPAGCPSPPKKPTVVANTAATFNKKYSELSFSSLRTVNKEEKQPKTLTQNVKNVRRSQEDIQKYIALVEQKFLKTFSLNEQEKEGAYKNLVDEIQGMLNVLNSKDKVDKKMKIKKSLEKLTNETTENVPIAIATPKQTPSTEKKSTKLASNDEMVVSYTKTLESVEKSLKTFQNDCEENSKISEAATEKLLSWKTSKPTPEDPSSKTSITSMHYTLSEKERIIEEKLEEAAVTALTQENNEPSLITIKEPVSMAETTGSEVGAKKKNSDFSGPTRLSFTITSSDSLTETNTDLSISSYSKFQFSKPKANYRRKQTTPATTATIKAAAAAEAAAAASALETANGTETSLQPLSNDNTEEDGYITITDFSELNSISSRSTIDIKITPLVDFSIDMYICEYLHYSYRCQRPPQYIVPHIYHRIQYTEKIDPKPITQAYKKKYSASSNPKMSSYDYDQLIFEHDYPVSSNLSFNNMLPEDQYSIENDFIKNYSNRLFTESINTILSKNSDLTLRNIFGSTTTTLTAPTKATGATASTSTTCPNSKRLSQKTSSNLYEYIDLLSNISRIFVEPEIAQFYQPKFVSYTSVPEREARTYQLAVIICRIHLTYSIFNDSKCNLLASDSVTDMLQCRSTDSTLTCFEGSFVLCCSSLDLSSDFPGDDDSFHSVKGSVSKFELLNDQINNLNVSTQNIEMPLTEQQPEDENEYEEQIESTLSLEELFAENESFATKKSSQYCNVDSLAQSIGESDSVGELGDIGNPKDNYESLGTKLAKQSHELGQLLLKTTHKSKQLPTLVSVKNFDAQRYMSYPTLNHFEYSYDCNYDFKLTISPKYLMTNFPSATCMQLLPLLRNRVGQASQSLIMKVELNHLNRLKLPQRHTSFKKAKRSIVGLGKAAQKCESFITARSQMNLNLLPVQIHKKEIYTESYKMILIFLYVSIFSFIFICMTLNYKCY